MIVPFAAGGPQDTISRIVAQRLGEILSNKSSSRISAAPAGEPGPNAWLMPRRTATHSVSAASAPTHKARPSIRSLVQCGNRLHAGGLDRGDADRADGAQGAAANNFKEFVQYAKANQSKMQFGSAGTGSATHLGCVVLNSTLKINPTHVPYRGTGPAMQDLHGGRIDYLCEIINTAKPHIEAGAIKGLAIMTKERSPVLPNLQTALEQGTPNLEAYTWSAAFMPHGVPDEIVKRMNAAIIATLDTPSVRESLLTSGAQIVSKDRMSPQYLGQFVKDEIVKWAAPIKASGATAD